MEERTATNRANWNERTPIHATSAFYDVAGFRSGRTTLNDIELRELGDVSGRTLLHLQCHFGMDTMSWARLGARATGVDFSDVAIDLARSLNDELGLEVRFLCTDIYDLPDVLDEQFDIVFTSLGVLCWLQDVDRWAQVVARFLRPGGVFYILDDHPLLGVFELAEPQGLRPVHSYFGGELCIPGGQPSYTGGAAIATPVYEWQHSLGDIVSALTRAGLRIEFLHEFSCSAYQAFPSMRRDEDGWWRFPHHNDACPQLFSIKATR